MNKIAIITLNGYFNYGNRLQNYALQEIVKSMGFSVETLVVPKLNNNKTLKDKLALVLTQSPRKSYYSIVEKFKALSKSDTDLKATNIRNEMFVDFTRTYIGESNLLMDNLKKPSVIADKYSFFIVGSDQVWNPHYVENSPIYLLEFVEKGKKVAYAPSFGVNSIPKKFAQSYKGAIRDFGYLSVREDKGAKIIRDICGIEAPVLVDPTLLISQKEWQAISKKGKNKPSKSYLLTYFLGEIPKKSKKNIRIVAENYDLETVHMGQVSEKETYATGPAEFIDYIKDCEIFFTDSFHGAVFAIIFNKPFVVFKRKGPLDMYSRIETLLKKFGLESRSFNQIDFSKDIPGVDFSYANRILEEEKEIALSFLQKALKSNPTVNS